MAPKESPALFWRNRMASIYARESHAKGQVHVQDPGMGLSSHEQSFLGRLAEMTSWCSDWTLESVTDLTYRNLQMHVEFQLDDTGAVTCQQHCRLVVLGRWQTPWRCIAKFRCNEPFLEARSKGRVCQTPTLMLDAPGQLSLVGLRSYLAPAVEREQADGQMEDPMPRQQSCGARELFPAAVYHFDGVQLVQSGVAPIDLLYEIRCPRVGDVDRSV